MADDNVFRVGDVPPVPQEPRETPKDTPPGVAAAEPTKRTRRSRGPNKASEVAELKEIEDKLAQVLGAPALAMHMAGETWPANHIETRALPLAHQITLKAKENAEFRKRLLSILRSTDGAQLLVAAVMYLIPVLIYYGFVPVPPALKAQLGVPDRVGPETVPWADPAYRPVDSPGDEFTTPEAQAPGTAGASPAPAA